MAPDYEVTRVLGGGGMGFVYLARDLTLDRVVAIKAIRPELATEVAVSRFLREARVLGRIRHPNIVPVHRAGMADGLPYYVMEYVEGETLAERLGRKRMTEREAVTTGRALLDALAAAHSAGVVHRDVKPANIFLTGPRVLLGDFGVARVDTTDPDATSTSGHIGTPAYMAPEQAAGGIVTEQSDIYAAGMVIYEMLTGRRWTPVADPHAADWSGVPRRYRHALRRALAWDPEQRWTRASAFRRVLAPRYRVMRRVTMSGWLFALLVVMGVVIWAWSRREPALPGPIDVADLAILPPRPTPASAAAESEAVAIAQWIDFDLSGIAQLHVSPRDESVRRWLNASELEREQEGAMCRALRANLCTGSTIRIIGDSLEYTLHVLDSRGVEQDRLRTLWAAGPDRAATLADTAALWLIGVAKPGLKHAIRSKSQLSNSLEAIRIYFAGEYAFFRDQPDAAAHSYGIALKLDPTFALARWRRTQALRWQPGEDADYRPDLDTLARAGPGRLDVVDSSLVQDQLLPPGRGRIAAFRETAGRFPQEELPWMLWGEELFHRGPLAGFTFDTARIGLERAVALDSLWPQPLQLLVWLHTRMGHDSTASKYLNQLRAVTADSLAQGFSFTKWLSFAATERFQPDSAARERERLLAAPNPGSLLTPQNAMRMPFAFDIPDAEAEWADLALRVGGPGTRISAYYGRFLADAARGRGQTALAYLDSATALMDTDTAELHAAEWRVIPLALGVPLFDEYERDVGRNLLQPLVGHPATRVRALWALGLDAGLGGDPLRATQWRDSLAALARDSAVRRLLPMLDGVRKAASGDLAGALGETDSLLVYDAYGQHGDPFARSVLHLLRSGWHEQLGENDAVERDLRWVDNMDVTGWPHDQPQAVEIDWVFGVETSYRRGLLAIARADAAAACAHFDRVLRFWSDSLAPAIDSLKRDVEAKHARYCAS